MPESLIVPDTAAALVGWRSWGLAKTPRGILLISHAETIWPADTPLQAACGRGSHLAPGNKCTCGIYALAEHDHFPYYAYDGNDYAVFGQVSLWGEVIRGSKGFRAQYAYPKTLYLAHKDWRYAQPLRETYRVPLRLRNPYAKQAI